MHVLVKAVFPPDKSDEIGKKFVEVMSKPLPKGIRRLETYLVVSQKGIEGYTIYRIKDENFVELYKELQNIYVGYHDIVGYRYRIDIVLTAAEALPMIGLKAPE